MTSQAAHLAGGDPHRRPAGPGRLVKRASLLMLLALAVSASISGSALAAPPDVTSPLLIGPVEADPPPAPKLPGARSGEASKSGRAGGKHAGSARKGGRHRHRSGAQELELAASCAPFNHTQTYAGWGPAVSYGETVTVVYQAARCSTPDGSALDVALEGTAQIFQGDSAAGALLDSKPFLVTGTWRQPQNAEAWPPTWWGCAVPYASYTWEIPGLYTFQVSARDGFWSLDVTSRGMGEQAVSWTHDGCA